VVPEVSPELVLVDPELAERERARINTASLYDDLLQEVNALVDRALELTSELPRALDLASSLDARRSS